MKRRDASIGRSLSGETGFSIKQSQWGYHLLLLASRLFVSFPPTSDRAMIPDREVELWRSFIIVAVIDARRDGNAGHKRHYYHADRYDRGISPMENVNTL